MSTKKKESIKKNVELSVNTIAEFKTQFLTGLALLTSRAEEAKTTRWEYIADSGVLPAIKVWESLAEVEKEAVNFPKGLKKDLYGFVYMATERAKTNVSQFRKFAKVRKVYPSWKEIAAGKTFAKFLARFDVDGNLKPEISKHVFAIGEYEFAYALQAGETHSEAKARVIASTLATIETRIVNLTSKKIVLKAAQEESPVQSEPA